MKNMQSSTVNHQRCFSIWINHLKVFVLLAVVAQFVLYFNIYEGKSKSSWKSAINLITSDFNNYKPMLTEIWYILNNFDKFHHYIFFKCETMLYSVHFNGFLAFKIPQIMPHPVQWLLTEYNKSLYIYIYTVNSQNQTNFFSRFVIFPR